MEDEVSVLKKRLKVWEGEFVKENDRKPGKDDIAVAACDIKDLYRQYYALKKNLSKEKSESKKENHDVSDNANAAEVWGSHLNKSKQVSKEEKDATKGKDNESSFMSNLGKKLLANASQASSHVEKRSWGIKKPTATPQTRTEKLTAIKTKSKSFLQPKKSSEQNDNEDDAQIKVTSSVFAMGLKVIQKNKDKLNDSLVSLNEEEKLDCFVNNLQHRKNAALKLQNKYRNVNLDNLDGNEKPSENRAFSSAVIPDENNAMLGFEDAMPGIKNTSHSSRPFQTFSHKKGNTNEVLDELSEPPFPISQNRGGKLDISNQYSVENKNNVNEIASYANKETSKKGDEYATETISTTEISPTRKFEEVSKFSQDSETLYSQIKPDNAPKTRIARKRKASDSDQSEKNVKRRNVRSKMDRDSLDSLNENSDSMFIDVGWRPGSRQELVMIELDSESMAAAAAENGDHLNNPDMAAYSNDEDTTTEEASERVTVKPSRKREYGPSKVTNDNFVRLNMKAKKYSRRGGGRSGSAHKRFAWKQKMKARSESFGGSKCFKCGQEGHWAKKCTGAARGNQPSTFDVSKAEENTVDDADFPSLSQAFNMAHGIKLHTNSPKPTPKKKKVPTATLR